MKPAIFVVPTSDATSDSEFVQRTITYDTGHQDFDAVLQKYVSNGAVSLGGDQIVAVPTLVRHLPPPMKKIIGDLSNEERVLVGLDLLPRRRGTGVRP